MKIVSEVLEQGWREGRGDIKSLVYSNSLVVDPDKAFKDFEKIHKKGETVIVYGYSYGGDAAVEFCEKLKTAGYKVDLLITVDGADGPLHGTTVDRTIPSNVKSNLNFYQTSFSSMSSRGDSNSAENPSKTEIINKKVTDKGVNHGSIDELTGNRAIAYMESYLHLKKSSITLNANQGSSGSSSGSSSNSSSQSSSSGSSFNESSSGSSGSSGSSQGSSESESSY